jgi:hypothetical protein
MAWQRGTSMVRTPLGQGHQVHVGTEQLLLGMRQTISPACVFSTILDMALSAAGTLNGRDSQYRMDIISWTPHFQSFV